MNPPVARDVLKEIMAELFRNYISGMIKAGDVSDEYYSKAKAFQNGTEVDIDLASNRFAESVMTQLDEYIQDNSLSNYRSVPNTVRQQIIKSTFESVDFPHEDPRVNTGESNG